MRNLIQILLAMCCLEICQYPAFSQSDQEPVIRFGYIDKHGQFVIEPKFISAADFSEGIAWVHSEETNLIDPNQIDAIDKHGKVLFGVSFKKPTGVGPFVGKFARVTLGENDFVDRSGKIVHRWDPAKHKEEDRTIQPFGRAQEDGEKLIFQPNDLSSTHQRWGHFYEGVCHVSYSRPEGRGQYQGFMDRNRQIVLQLPQKIKACGDFHDGLAPVSVGGDGAESDDTQRLGFINHNGFFLIPPIYDVPLNYPRARNPIEAVQFHDHVALVKQNGENCYVDEYGHCFARFSGDMCSDFSDGLARVGVLVNAKGERVDAKQTKPIIELKR